MREPHVRFDERDLETEQLPLLPRQISTLPELIVVLRASAEYLTYESFCP